ncbi:MAG: tetratricopeptide repeat protein [Elusimicrobiota bacterium]|nr:tetratricopeptide repeat protein [Elusimicrobiota bacterium]
MRPWHLAAAALAVAACASVAMERRRPWAGPSLSELEATPFAFRDAVLASGGLRAVAADLAWVQLLQYMAGNLPEIEDRPGRRHDRVLQLSRRVMRLDPHFHRAPLYGASILGWFEEVDRPDEAVELLDEAIRRAPEEPLFKLYLAAMAFKRAGDDARMVALLERSFDDPRAPSTMKAILANLYQRRGEPAKALETWERVLANPLDASEHARARLKIVELRAALRAGGRQPWKTQSWPTSRPSR